MPEIYEITGADLSAFVSEVLQAATRLEGNGRLAKVSVTIDGGVKIKVNELMWTPPLGKAKGRECPVCYRPSDGTDCDDCRRNEQALLLDFAREEGN